MSDTLLDTIDEGTKEAEEQLLQELARIRTEHESDYAQIDEAKRDALNDLVDHLWNQLAPSVDGGSLSLRTVKARQCFSPVDYLEKTIRGEYPHHISTGGSRSTHS